MLIQSEIDITEYLDKIGEPGSNERLNAISCLNLGERSDAARRVLDKRHNRIDLMNKGLTFEDACLIVNKREAENYYIIT